MSFRDFRNFAVGLLAIAVGSLLSPAFGQSTATPVVPGVSTTVGCPNGSTACFIPYSAANPTPIGGNVASGSADTGNPVKVGCVYNATQPTFTTGNRGDCQIDVRGNHRTVLVTSNGTTASSIVAGSDGLANSNGSLVTAGFGYVFNGTSWDRLRAGPYQLSQTPVTGIGSGTTGAVTGTLTATASTTAYVCNVDVSAIGGTAAVGPITITGLVGGTFTYQASATAAGGLALSRTFTPCIPASAVNTNIVITTTADGTATAVNVNASGFLQ